MNDRDLNQWRTEVGGLTANQVGGVGVTADGRDLKGGQVFLWSCSVESAELYYSPSPA